MEDKELTIHPSEVDIFSLHKISCTYEKFKNDLHERVRDYMDSITQSNSINVKKLNKLLNELVSTVEPFVKELFEKCPNRYYEILRDYYCQHPEKMNQIRILDKVEMLEDIQYQTITTVLLYQWLFECNNSEFLRLFPTFLRIIHSLFWLDLNDESKRFYPIFEYFYKKLLLSTSLWKGTVKGSLTEVFNLVTKFYFYYIGTSETLERDLYAFLHFTQKEFTKIKNDLELPKGHRKIHTTNMFANELIRHMRHIKNENILVTYLNNCKFLRKNELGRKTRIRFQRLLIDFYTPGTPLYPTRNVRIKSKETLDELFPHGRMMRKVVNLAFRLLDPFATAASGCYWINRYFTTIFSVFLLGIFSIFIFFFSVKIKSK